MSLWLSKKELKRTEWADKAFESPIPTQVVSNGEFMPPPQSREQARVEQAVKELGEHFAMKQGMTRRQFLRTNCGMAAAFLAMNMVYGPLFAVHKAEAMDKEAAQDRSKALADQFIFDVQLHYVHGDYPAKEMLQLREWGKEWNPALKGEAVTLESIKFQNFLNEVYLDSETTLGLLSSAPADNPEEWFITNDQAIEARRIVNELAGSRRLLSHAIFTPGQPGWLEEMDRAIEVLKPNSWKGYTVGSPDAKSRFPWRLDDEKLVYPAYEKMDKAGIRNVCIHKGLLPPDVMGALPDLRMYAGVDDLGKAARDWPQLNFIIYHAAFQSFMREPVDYYAQFEKTQRIPWVSDLAEIPGKHGVTNVYGEIGSSFAVSAVAHPKYCAAMLGTLIKGLGDDHVVWGTDSIWYGSPQWQIEAMRRIEIPEEMQEKYGFSPLGPADGPVKKAIFGYTSAKHYGIDPEKDYGPSSEVRRDRFAQMREQFEAGEHLRSNRFYGLIHKRPV